MIYTVKRIDESDYGCEERPEGAPAMVLVTLVDDFGKEFCRLAEDDLLYQRDINEGDKVYIDENDQLSKALDEDWTRSCNSKNVDISAFVDMMEAVKTGKKIDWKCPFSDEKVHWTFPLDTKACGGSVGLISTDGKQTEIGCDSCDMRINLGTN